MSSPTPANEAETQSAQSHEDLTNTLAIHKVTSTADNLAAALSPVDTSKDDNVLEPCEPKSEEPPLDFSSIAEELVNIDSAPGANQNPLTDCLSTQHPHSADLNHGLELDVLQIAHGENNPPLPKVNLTGSRKISIKKRLFKTPLERTHEAKEIERRLEAAGDNFHKSLEIKAGTTAAEEPSTQGEADSSYDTGNIDVVETGYQSIPIELDTEAEDVSAAARFKSLKRSYERKKKRETNLVEDDIAFSKARNAESQRLKLKSRKRAYQDMESEVEIVGISEEDDMLFLAEEHPPASTDGHEQGEDLEAPSALKRRKPCRANKIPESALHEATQIGFDMLKADARKKASRKPRAKRASAKKDPKEQTAGIHKVKGRKSSGIAAESKNSRARKGPQMMNFETLFNNDIVCAAQANIGEAAQPGFTSRNKKDALAELIASIPSSERSLTHTADKNALEKATRSFSGHAAMRADGQNGWRLRGMKTSLYHYQLLGAAFMRDRENTSTRPYGGLQSDEMGLGKTITCLANIVDGQAPLNSPNRTTLIVCPTGLCSQWLNEIRNHVLDTTFQETIIYRAGARVESTNPLKTLSNMDIIITSYNEIRRSYPHSEAPLQLMNPDQKAEWWTDHFNKNRGVLHQIYFRRIVLDEAQVIKNHNSKISMAVRSLSGKYRWAITGTPLQNAIEEFYSYFAFLKVPNTGSFETFKNNFTGRSQTSNLRLQTILQEIMIRRTHLDRIFGRPLLQLPGITTKTVSVEFSELERAIYKIVKDRFVAKIRTYARSGDLDKRYQSILVLFLRLRQLVGHILLIQQTLKDLLESEDLEKISRLCEVRPQGAPQGAARSQATVTQLKKMISQASATAGKSSTPGGPQDSPEHVGPNDMANNKGPIAFRFKKYLRSLKDSGKWEQINKQSLCHKCGSVPDSPHVTSCFHIYCKECLEDMLFTAGRSGGDKAKCLACDIEFEVCEPCRGFDQADRKLNQSMSGTPDRRVQESADSEESDIDWLTVGGPMLLSAKTLAVKAQIQNWVEEDQNAKVIIFTQFNPMIRILSRVMTEEDWGWCQFHGSMSFAARDKAVLDFAEKPEIKVMLASLKAGGVGLNLTMASKVIILDLWWNESVEQQAFCRCFRIGQDRPVDICRIVVKDSIDDDILAMQARKTRDIDMAMAAKNRPGKLTTQELLRLFGPIDWNAEDESNPVAEPFIFVEDEDDTDDLSENGNPNTVPPPPFEF